MPALGVRVEAVTKCLGHTLALQGVSTVFEPGRVHGIVGPNGAGKTTLMRVLTGLLKPTQGEVFYYDAQGDVSAAQAKGQTGYFPQEPSLYPDLSCREHLEFFRDLYDLPSQAFESRAKELFDATGMSAFAGRPAGKLSGGMYKKLGLMCVLLNRPRLLLLDEPTVGVDPVSRQELWELVYGFAGQETTVVLSTSYMDEAQRCSKVHILDGGVLKAADTPQALMRRFEVTQFADIFLKK